MNDDPNTNEADGLDDEDVHEDGIGPQVFDVLAFERAPQVALPDLFYSEETGRPFARCIDCQTTLLDEAGGESAGYMIQKVFVRNESVFEFAMCHDCREKLEEEFSDETRAAFVRFTAENVDFNRLRLQIANVGHASAEDWIAECLICQRPRRECHRYSLGGFCAAGWLKLGPGPFIICDECENRVGELVSESTRRGWDRFVEDHFDSPPWIESDSPMLPVLV